MTTCSATPDQPIRRGTGAPWNPFSLECTRPGAITWITDEHSPRPGEILRSLEAVRAGAICGAHGTGKSTLMTHVAGCAESRGSRSRFHVAAGDDAEGRPPGRAAMREFRRAVRRDFATLGHTDLLVIDGAERLGERFTERLAQRARNGGPMLLVSVHGRTSLDVLHHRRVDARLARDLAAERLRRVGTDVQPVSGLIPLPDEAWFARALQESDSNLRTVFGMLYRRFEQSHRMSAGSSGDRLVSVDDQ